jgi:polysaccharide export outer membrane protein
LESQWVPARPLPSVTAGSPTISNSTPSAILERLAVGVGDQIYITVFGQPDMSAEVTVNDNQQVTLPLIGTLKVGGLTPPTLEKLIAQRLKEGEYLLNPEVSIQVRQVRSQMMSVLGEVQRPGRFVIAGKMTVLDALATAGGFTQRADPTVVLVRRNTLKNGESQRQELTFRMDYLINSNDGELDLELKNDDVVFVAQQKSFYIFGEVRKPGAYPMELDLNIMRVLSISGGVTDRGSLKRIRIHRKDAAQIIQEITPQLNDPVVSGDVIYVNERLF